MEEYPGPAAPVDLVVLGHVLYYFMPEVEALLRRALGWLRPGGVLLLSHSAPHPVLMQISE